MFSAAWLLFFRNWKTPGNCVGILQTLHIFNDWSSIRFPFPNALILSTEAGREINWTKKPTAIRHSVALWCRFSIPSKIAVQLVNSQFSFSAGEDEMDTGSEQNIIDSDKKFHNNNSSILLDCRFEECHETLEMQSVRYIHLRFFVSFPHFIPFLVSQLGKRVKLTSIWLVSNVKCRTAFIASHEIELKIAQLHHSILNLNVNPFIHSVFSSNSWVWVLLSISCRV